MADPRHPIPLRPRAEPAEVEVLDGPPPGWPRPGLLAAAGRAVGGIGRALLPALPRASAAALVRAADGGRGAVAELRAAADSLGRRASAAARRVTGAVDRTRGQAEDVMARLRARLAASRGAPPAAPDPGGSGDAPTEPREALTARAGSVIAALRRRLGPLSASQH